MSLHRTGVGIVFRCLSTDVFAHLSVPKDNLIACDL